MQLAARSDALAVLGAALVLATLWGLRARNTVLREGRGLLPACEVDKVDTTGAGDAFWERCCRAFAGKTLEELRILPQAYSGSALSRLQTQRAALTTRGKGAIPAMAAREQILRLCGE